MLRPLLVLLALSAPALAQTKTPAKPSRVVVDPCAPIGRLADGTLVYSMKCENLPPVAVAPPTPESQLQRSGLFGMSYTRKPTGE